MKTIIYFLSIIFVLFLTSCEDAFTTVKEIDIPEHESKLSVFVELNAADGSFFVSNSKKIDDNKPYESINGSLELYENGIKLRQIYFNSSHLNLISFDPELKPGNEYKLIVENDEYGTATSTQVMPYKTEIIDASYEKDGIVSSDGNKEDKFTIEFQDDKNTNSGGVPSFE